MSQSDTEQQLRIWKDLAIGKQVLMNEAANALELGDDFTAEDLRSALDTAVKRARDADADIIAARNRAAEEIGAMQAEVKKTEKARAEAERQRDEALRGQESAEQSLETGRQDNADALKKARRDVENQKKELKAINTALADTPENILKKLKTLKKQKLDEATARKSAEDVNRKLKKESKEQKEELDKLEGLKEKAATLLASYRELDTWAGAVAEKLGDDAEKAPSADAKLLSEIETVTAAADADEGDDKEGAAGKKGKKSREAAPA